MVGLLGISEYPWSHPWSHPWSYPWNPMKLWINKDLSAALSCTQLHSAALSCTQLPAFCKNGARFAAYTICEYFFVAFFLRGTPGPRWSEMIWNDLKWSEVSRPPNHASLMFLMIFEKHWIFKGYNNMIYNDWTTGNMNSVSFTKTLENFDMESQKLGFRAVPTGNGNFWGTGVRCTGEEFHNRSLFRQQTCNMSSIALPSGKLT